MRVMCTPQRCCRNTWPARGPSLCALSTSPRRSETRADRWPSPCGSPLLGLGDRNGTLAQPRAESCLAECRGVDRRQGRHGPAWPGGFAGSKAGQLGLCHPRVVADRTVQARKDLGWDCRRQRLSRISRSGLDCVGAPQRRGRAGPGSRLAAKHVVVGAHRFLRSRNPRFPRQHDRHAAGAGARTNRNRFEFRKYGPGDAVAEDRRGGARCDLFFQAKSERQDILQLCGREHEGDLWDRPGGCTGGCSTHPEAGPSRRIRIASTT